MEHFGKSPFHSYPLVSCLLNASSFQTMYFDVFKITSFCPFRLKNKTPSISIGMFSSCLEEKTQFRFFFFKDSTSHFDIKSLDLCENT